jgi:RNA-binding signal recognition particle 68
LFRKLYEELAKVGTFEQQSICEQQMEGIEPTMRYCKYQINRKGGAGANTSELIKLGGQEGPGSDFLQVCGL